MQTPANISVATEVAAELIWKDCIELRRLPDYDLVRNAFDSAIEACIPEPNPEVIITIERSGSDCVIEEIAVVGRATRKRKGRALRNNFYIEIQKYEREEKVPHIGKVRQPHYVRRHARYLQRGVRYARTHRRKTAFVVKQAIEAIFSGVYRTAFQAGKALRKQARAERDEAQRKAAAFKRKMRYKMIPKQQREASFKSRRDKRNAVHSDAFDSLEEHFERYSLEDDVKLQSGMVLPLAAGVFLGTIGSALWKLIKKADGMVDKVNAFMKQFKSVVDSIKKHFGSVMWLVPTTVIVYFALKKFANVNSVVSSLLVTALSSIVGKEVWAVISKFFPSGDAQLQAGIEPGTVSKLMATVFTFSVFKKKMTPMLTTEFVKRISTIDRAANGWDAFMRWFMEALEGLINFARGFFNKDRINLIRKNNQHIVDWARRVDKISCAEAIQGGDITPAKLDEMVDVIRLGFEYRELYRGLPLARQVDECLAKAVTALAPYQGSLNARHNYRYEPAAAMFIGQPGIGKTLMAMPFCAAVMLESGLVSTPCTTDDIMKNVWQKGTSEFWNGYAGQTCLVMDDAFQARANPTDKENDYMSMIRMVSTWSMPLNFADLASKGKIYFGSKFIFGTTNLSSFDSEARIVLQEPEAVSRRINFPYKIRVKQEYATNNGRLDYEKYLKEVDRASQSETPLHRYPWYMWEAAKHDFLTGRTEQSWTSLLEVVKDVAADLRKRTDNYTVSREALSSFVSGYQLQSGRGVIGGGRARVRVRVRRLVDVDQRLQEEMMQDVAAFQAVNNPPVQQPPAPVQAQPQRDPPNSFAHRFSKVVKETCSWFLSAETLFESFCKGYLFGMVVIVAKNLLCMLWDTISNFFKGGKKKVATQSNRPLQPKKNKQTAVQLQSVDSSVATNIYNNTYKIVVDSKAGPYIIGQILFLVSDLVVQPEHFTSQIREMLKDGEIVGDSSITFRSAVNSSFNFSVSVTKYLSFKRVVEKEKDIEFLVFQDVRAHRRIISNIMRESDIQHVSGYRGRLDICQVDDSAKIVNHNQRKVYAVPSVKHGSDLRVGGKKISRFFKYDAPTDLGDCGAPLCVLDNSTFSGRSLLGLHVAGDRSRSWGFSNILTQEMVEKAMEALKTIDDKFEEDLSARGVELQSGHDLPFSTPGSFLPIGTVSKPVTICPKTSYYPTDLFGVFGDYDYYPAPLSPVWRDGNLIYPMEQAVAPYSSPVYIYEQKWLEQAMHVATRPLTALTMDMPRRLYTFEEAVVGVPEEKFRSIPRNTAAGFPYIYDLRNGKREFFGSDGEYTLDSDMALELRKRVDHVLDQASKGVRLSHVFVDFLKDELRSKKKVEAVATRLISSAPLDYTVAWRMMFGAFSSAVMRVHTVSGMAPGICCYTDWDVLVQQLKKKGELCFDGDFKAFDSSEQPCVHRLILDYINRWYDDGDVNARIREVLWMDLVHSRHIGGLGADQRYIYQWNKSLPSGHPFTTIVNSIYSLFLLVAAYISSTGELSNFWTNVSAVTYGDDNVSNVSPDYADKYNQLSVAQALKKEFSVDYTPGSKTGEYVETMSLSEVTFLKRGFVDRDGNWLCPLELDSFLYTCYWCKNKKLEGTIMIDVLENALLELSMHDPNTWAKYARSIGEELLNRGHVPQALLTQSEYLKVIQSRSDNWY